MATNRKKIKRTQENGRRASRKYKGRTTTAVTLPATNVHRLCRLPVRETNEKKNDVDTLYVLDPTWPIHP